VRVLVLGAGAVGGYFGGRLLEAGRDVSFLVRSRRAKQLRSSGLVIRSPFGDARLNAPILIAHADSSFDLVILSCKAYDLDSAVEAIAPAVGPDTTVLPLLNGLRHLDLLDQRLGAGHVLGGSCLISSTLDRDGAILHLNRMHELRFGERQGGLSPRVAAIGELMSGAIMVSKLSVTILQEMWEKWVGIATLAGITCLMRGSIGDIVAAPGGRAFVLQLLDECAAVAAANSYSPRPDFMSFLRKTLTEPDSTFAASMLRDVERGGQTEADHILGDLIERADAKDVAVPLLRTSFCHLKTYERRRASRS
jgi:2-dehydropantoate 2-reductase